MKLKDLFKQHDGDESQWISMSDIMTGLMVIFLLLFLVSVISHGDTEELQKSDDWRFKHGSLLKKYNIQGKKLKETETRLAELRGINNELHSQIIAKRKSLITNLQNIWSDSEKEQYGIVISDTGAIDLLRGTFRPSGSKIVRPPLIKTLEDIMPNFIDYIKANENLIDRVEIVGHASPEFPLCKDKFSEVSKKYDGDIERCKYFENMILSQERSHAVLIEIDKILDKGILGLDEFELIKNIFFANGRSSSDTKKTINDNIDYEGSRRAVLYVHYDITQIQKTIIAQN